MYVVRLYQEVSPGRDAGRDPRGLVGEPRRPQVAHRRQAPALASEALPAADGGPAPGAMFVSTDFLHLLQWTRVMTSHDV